MFLFLLICYYSYLLRIQVLLIYIIFLLQYHYMKIYIQVHILFYLIKKYYFYLREKIFIFLFKLFSKIFISFLICICLDDKGCALILFSWINFFSFFISSFVLSLKLFLREFWLMISKGFIDITSFFCFFLTYLFLYILTFIYIKYYFYVKIMISSFFKLFLFFIYLFLN